VIQFIFGLGAGMLVGRYTADEGIVIDNLRPTIADLPAVLNAEIDSYMLSEPMSFGGRYGAAEFVLRQWGAQVDTSQVPAHSEDVAY